MGAGARDADATKGLYDWAISDQFNNARMAFNLDGSDFWWWLRSPGFYPNYAAYVFQYGYLFLIGHMVGREGGFGGGVRPALWLYLDVAPMPDPPHIEYSEISASEQPWWVIWAEHWFSVGPHMFTVSENASLYARPFQPQFESGWVLVEIPQGAAVVTIGHGYFACMTTFSPSFIRIRYTDNYGRNLEGYILDTYLKPFGS